jgi:hypothetical protein
LWYYRAIATTLAAVRGGQLVDELERAVTLLESLADGSTRK